MFANNHKYKRYNAHVVMYKDFLNENKQMQRDSHIYWFKELQRRAEAENIQIELKKKRDVYIKHRMADKNIIKTNHLIIPALILSMGI